MLKLIVITVRRALLASIALLGVASQSVQAFPHEKPTIDDLIHDAICSIYYDPIYCDEVEFLEPNPRLTLVQHEIRFETPDGRVDLIQAGKYVELSTSHDEVLSMNNRVEEISNGYRMYVELGSERGEQQLAYSFYHDNAEHNARTVQVMSRDIETQLQNFGIYVEPGVIAGPKFRACLLSEASLWIPWGYVAIGCLIAHSHAVEDD